MLRSLRQLSLSNYSYKQVKDLCSDPSFYNVFDCDWAVWRDKAVSDFAISPEFFDLVPTLSGPQRYLQISTYERLSRDSLAKSLDEGVYEAVAGFREAVMRDDYDMVLFFYDNLTDEQKNYVLEVWTSFFEILDRAYPTLKQAKKLINFGLVEPPKQRDDYSLLEKGSEEAFQRLFLDEKRKDINYPQRMDFLQSVLISGRLDFIDAIIHDYFVLPQGFSISKDIIYVPFWEYRGENFYPLPPQDHIDHMQAVEIMESAVTSCNSRVVDFFLSMFRNVHEREIEVSQLLQRGMRIQPLYRGAAKAEEAYGISMRFPNLPFYNFMSEFLLDEVTKTKDSHYITRVALNNDGNITMLTSILPYLNKQEMERHSRYLQDIYPLEHELF